ncbi:hypothetical protein QCM80_09340 [Bradyrhizobium sp. SSUT112]|uniref:hypothetical protein n=1 Tax=Bradyrhizobium sp. SSUT112 TaxID=3040604 RepID=UPI00244C3B7E|nr:hypothetical protein [Bradyrhizobium sp. SSUT112]MDH2350870.1 hypothetical protein [Bradyrhizobium sp. SSUT112]
MESTFDDTLPPADEVEREFFDKAEDKDSAIAWLADHGVEAPPPQHVALIQYGVVWTPETGRYKFVVYGAGHLGPKRPHELAVPIFEDGAFIDLLVISDDQSWSMVTCRTPWLGRENLAQPVVRLHPHPMDWLQAGCDGVCYVEPIGRKALKELAKAQTIECNDIATALEAWDWAFESDESELARFEIDDTPRSINAYYEGEVRRHAARAAADIERGRSW